MRKIFFKEKIKNTRRAVASLLVIMMMTGIVLTTGVTEVRAEQATLTGKDAFELIDMMGTGISIGNTLDSTGGSAMAPQNSEMTWGNPRITEELVDGIIAEGFNTIRIPITWESFIMTNGTYKVLDGYMNRVKTVVDYAYGKDVFIIINVHHESWINRADIVDSKDEIKAQLQGVWTQIADTFADYDQHLIFEGMNEPRLAGTDKEWTGDAASREVVNELSQAFVDTVRANGKGYNRERLLMVPDYAASSGKDNLKAFVFPTINGKLASNVAVSIHSYTPYLFCLTTSKQSFHPQTDGKDIDYVFKDIKEIFLDKGMPVVLGETSATNQNNEDDRIAWAEYFGTTAGQYGVPTLLWDNGSSNPNSGESHDYFVRTTGETTHHEMIQTLINSYNEAKNTSSYTYGITEYCTDADMDAVYGKVGAEEAEEAVNNPQDTSDAADDAQSTEENDDEIVTNTVSAPIVIGIIIAALLIVLAIVATVISKRRG